MHKVRSDPELLAVHEAGYLAYRDALQHLIEALPRKTRPGQTRSEAIACNALIDGLWIEGSLLRTTFEPGEVVTIGLRSVGAILGVDLIAHSAMLPDPGKTL